MGWKKDDIDSRMEEESKHHIDMRESFDGEALLVLGGHSSIMLTTGILVEEHIRARLPIPHKPSSNASQTLEEVDDAMS
jgi:hypothetical protein